MRRTQIPTQVGHRAGSRPALPVASSLHVPCSLWHLVQGRQRQRKTQPAGRRAPRPGSNALAAEFGVDDMRAQLYLGFPASARVRAQAPRDGASSSSAAICAWRASPSEHDHAKRGDPRGGVRELVELAEAGEDANSLAHSCW
ncbi:hypothetical protein HWV62_33244, partial [Athelia sp. TMB]